VKKETISQKNENASVNSDKKESTADEKPAEAPKEASSAGTSAAAATTPTPASKPQPVSSNNNQVSSRPSSNNTVASTPTSTSAPAPSPAPTPAPAFDPEDYVEGRLLSLINAERARVGVAALASNGLLNQAADIRVAEEAIVPTFSWTDHTRPNGSTFDTVYPQLGYTGYTAWGENLVWGYKPAFSYTTANLDAIAQQMFTSWKNSSGHYKNMISSTYNQTGFGVKLVKYGNYIYYFAIEDFARR
jgi:uncharacterized protein YkwD